MKISTDQVREVAKLSNLDIPDSDLETYASQLSEILDYVNQLNAVDTSGVEPTFNVSPVSNVWQDDQVEPSLTQGQSLANAPVKKDGFFITEGVFGDE